jgi:hypothetical protein
MATVAYEQVTQPYKIGDVSITDGTDESLIGQRLWLSTTTLPNTVVNTKAVAADQDTPSELLTLSDTVDANLDDEQTVPGGDDISDQVLVKLGDTTLSAANNAITTKDISAFVAGGFGTLHYSLDDTSVIDLAGCSAQMAGDTLVYTSAATDGTDSAVVRVTDDAGEYVLITVAVTVA